MTLVHALAAFGDACPSLAHHPGDDPAVQPHDVTRDVNGSLRAVYECPCGRSWSQRWTLEAAPWPRAVQPRISTRAELAADFAELRGWGLTVPEAAARLGVTPRTATRYGADLRDEAAA